MERDYLFPRSCKSVRVSTDRIFQSVVQSARYLRERQIDHRQPVGFPSGVLIPCRFVPLAIRSTFMEKKIYGDFNSETTPEPSLDA